MTAFMLTNHREDPDRQGNLANRIGAAAGSEQAGDRRYEENEYQTVAMAKLQEILDAIGIKTLVTLRA